MKMGRTFVGAVSLTLMVPGWAVAVEQKMMLSPTVSPGMAPQETYYLLGVPVPDKPVPNDQPRATPEQKLKIWGADQRSASGCQASAVEAPCAALGVASLPSTKAIKTAIGNPVNPQTGQKVQVDLDVEPTDGPLSLEIRRHYNSALGSVNGALGKAWSFSYDTRVLVTRKTIQIIQADGFRRIFWKPQAQASSVPGVSADVAGSGVLPGMHCVSTSPEDGQLTVLPEGGYRWVWPDGRQLDFNVAGWLVRVSVDGDGTVAGSGATRVSAAGHAQRGHSGHEQVLTIDRAKDGKIQTVTDPAGRRMTFRYDPHGYLMAIDHPQGTWRYRVSADGHLQSVESPTGNRRFFRYEDTGFPSALTAIEVESPQLGRRVTLSQWKYDVRGRVREYRGWRGEDMRFAYLPTDARGIETTEVTDRQGRKQTYRFRSYGGVWQTLSITGQDCTHCRLIDRAYRYDDAGRLTGMHQWRDTKRQRLHREFHFERDHLGRTLAVYQRTWRQKKAADGKLQNGPASVAWQLHRRYDYASAVNPYPALIERPSVEPGQMYQVRFQYEFIGGRLLPVEIIESGYSHGERVSRSVHASYDDSGLLLSIDGPLPGAEDTVQVRRNRLDDGQSTWTLIDSLGREISRDTDHWAGSSMAWLEDVGHFHAEAGALRHVADNGAENTLQLDDFNRITQTVSADAGTDTIWYDAADRVIRETDSTGAEVRFTHDAWDRPLSKTVTGPDGFREETRYRYEGRWLVEVQGASSTERYQHDAQGRITAREVEIHPAGAPQRRTFSYRYTYAGSSERPDTVQMPDGAVISRVPVLAKAGRPETFNAATGMMNAGGVFPDAADGGRQAHVLMERSLAQGHSAVGQALAFRTMAVEVTLKESADARRGLPLYRRTLTGSEAAGQGHEDHWQLGNGYERRLLWNAQNQLTALREALPDTKAPKDVLYGMRYAYRPDGRIAQIDTLTDSNRYLYDDAGRLIIAQKQAHAEPLQGMSGSRRGHEPHGGSEPRKVSYSSSQQTAQAADPMPESGHAVSARWYAYDDNGNRLFTGVHTPGEPAVPGTSDTAQPTLASFADVTGTQTSYVSRTNHQRDVRYDAAGRPLMWQDWQLTWHPGGQIMTMVHTDGRQIRYFYNHRGERIARQQGSDWQFYDYGQGRLQAQASSTTEAIRYWWYEGEIPVAVIERGPQKKGFFFNSAGELTINWLHVDHRGLPLMSTDAKRQVVWQQAFGPFGEPQGGALVRGAMNTMTPVRTEAGRSQGEGSRHAAGSSGQGRGVMRAAVAMQGNAGAASDVHAFGADPMLRLPGQWADAATGLYYNMMRDYDPMMGRYVSPDPLGMRAGPNPYLYVGADPLKNVDPTGLMLFAFDGTHNAPDRPTNVWHFFQAYNAGANGPGSDVTRAYLEGVGVENGPNAAYGRTEERVHREKLEPIYAWRWKENVEFQVMRFMTAVGNLKEGETLNVDVVGFSRGSVQALEFGRIVARMLNNGEIANSDRVNLRFLGLMDPVMTNMYSDVEGWEQKCKPMDVDSRWENVVNIVAAHDRRGNLFKGGSLGSQVNMRPNGDMRGLNRDSLRKLNRNPENGRWTGVREEIFLAGAHSDIGGGWLGPESAEPDSDLSDVSLWVLMERAERAGVVLNELPEHLQRVDLPVNHKNSLTAMNLAQGWNGRTYLVDGHWVEDKRMQYYGVRPDSRPYPGYREPENDYGMNRVGIHDQIVQSPFRKPENAYWRHENSMDMEKYCKFLIDQSIISSGKYARNCRATTLHKDKEN